MISPEELADGRRELDRECERVARDPTRATITVFLRGSDYGKDKDYAEAERRFKKAIEEEPFLNKPYVNLSQLYERMGRRQDALDTALLGLKLFPDDYKINLQVGRVYMNRGQVEEGIPFLERAKELGPREPEILQIMKQLGRTKS